MSELDNNQMQLTRSAPAEPRPLQLIWVLCRRWRGREVDERAILDPPREVSDAMPELQCPSDSEGYDRSAGVDLVCLPCLQGAS